MNGKKRRKKKKKKKKLDICRSDCSFLFVATNVVEIIVVDISLVY